MKTENRKTGNKWKDILILCFIAAGISLISTFLFYRQVTKTNGLYLSDLPAHISYAINTENYSLCFKMIKAVYLLSGGNGISVALLEGIIFGLTWICTTLTIEKLSRLKRWICMAIAAGLLFLTNIYIPVWFPRFYMGSIISQPWHNITYASMRPFAVLTILFFSDLFSIYRNEKKISGKYWGLTCASLFMATLMKPNFLMAFAPALLTFLIVDLLKKKNTFKNEFILGCVVLPACAIMPIQALLLFDEESGIIFAPSIFFFTEGKLIFIMKFVSCLTLPLLIYIYNRRNLLKGADFAAIGYLWSLLEGMFFMESGMRQTHGNFLWGCEIMGYILFMYAVPMLLINIREYLKGNIRKTTENRIYIISCSVLLCLHLLSGIAYMIWIYRGNFYYV